MASATQTGMSNAAVAPTLFFFKPKNIWVLASQWGAATFTYRTSSDPTNPNGWSSPSPMFRGNDLGVRHWTHRPDSHWRQQEHVSLLRRRQRQDLSNIDAPRQIPLKLRHQLRGRPQRHSGKPLRSRSSLHRRRPNKYLMMSRLWDRRAATSAATPLPASAARGPSRRQRECTFRRQVQHAGQWTNDISHGDLIRSTNDQTMTIDPCNLQMLYQAETPVSRQAATIFFLTVRSVDLVLVG